MRFFQLNTVDGTTGEVGGKVYLYGGGWEVFYGKEVKSGE